MTTTLFVTCLFSTAFVKKAKILFSYKTREIITTHSKIEITSSIKENCRESKTKSEYLKAYLKV